MQNVQEFTIPTSNPFWNTLKESNDALLRAKDKHHKAMLLCRDSGVAFEDIRTFSLNQAKKARLYVKEEDNNGNENYPSKKTLRERKPAWFICHNRFCSWVERNYSSYETKIERVKKAKDSTDNKRLKNIKVTERIDSETGETVVTTAVEANSDITSPVTTDLTTQQVQTIITMNWEILGQFCKEKGAEEEFKALMDKLEA